MSEEKKPEERIFLGRPAGMPFSEFKRRCVEVFKARGIIQSDDEALPSGGPAQDQPTRAPDRDRRSDAHVA